MFSKAKPGEQQSPPQPPDLSPRNVLIGYDYLQLYSLRYPSGSVLLLPTSHMLHVSRPSFDAAPDAQPFIVDGSYPSRWPPL